jgi:hypothetical protein
LDIKIDVLSPLLMKRILSSGPFGGNQEREENVREKEETEKKEVESKEENKR